MRVFVCALLFVFATSLHSVCSTSRPPGEVPPNLRRRGGSTSGQQGEAEPYREFSDVRGQIYYAYDDYTFALPLYEFGIRWLRDDCGIVFDITPLNRAVSTGTTNLELVDFVNKKKYFAGPGNVLLNIVPGTPIPWLMDKGRVIYSLNADYKLIFRGRWTLELRDGRMDPYYVDVHNQLLTPLRGCFVSPLRDRYGVIYDLKDDSIVVIRGDPTRVTHVPKDRSGKRYRIAADNHVLDEVRIGEVLNDEGHYYRVNNDYILESWDAPEQGHGH